ncbi:STAS domain-containing protein [Tunturibacter psychrotolerans]|uniref:STAS domain-containing protein n=1 Tax=Tunturiibacter psychrotolerans TaxID=3069686 RepID=A0AAU7ZUA3_9BACT
MLLTLMSRHIGKVFLIRCKGRIVLGEEVKALEVALEGGAWEFSQLVVELSGISRLDSIGLGLLVRYSERMRRRGGDLRLAGSPQFLLDLLKMTKVSASLESYATEEEAIQSYLKERPAEAAKKREGPRVVVVDESVDLCVFVRAVLTQHGYDVRATCSFRDAKTLLQTDGVEYILVGPSTPHLSAETVVETLTALAPRAKALRLDPEFKIRDVQEASDALLQLFAADGV